MVFSVVLFLSSLVRSLSHVPGTVVNFRYYIFSAVAYLEFAQGGSEVLKSLNGFQGPGDEVPQKLKPFCKLIRSFFYILESENAQDWKHFNQFTLCSTVMLMMLHDAICSNCILCPDNL